MRRQTTTTSSGSPAAGVGLSPALPRCRGQLLHQLLHQLLRLEPEPVGFPTQLLFKSSETRHPCRHERT